MSFKVAVASTDGVNVDMHFGRADKFYIYEAEIDEAFQEIEVRSVPQLKFCGTGNGCSGGGGGNSHEGLSEITELLGDCKYVLAAKVGNGIEKALLRSGITAFPIELPINKAISKIGVYEKRLHQLK